MTKPLVSLGIAETVFYAPVAPLAMYLMYRNRRKPPRLAWYPFILLTLSKSEYQTFSFLRVNLYALAI